MRRRNGAARPGRAGAAMTSTRPGEKDLTRMNVKLIGALGLVAMLAACGNTEESANTGGAGSAVTGAGPRPGSQEDLVANVGDRVLFDFDRSSIRADQRPVLERQAAWMAR